MAYLYCEKSGLTPFPGASPCDHLTFAFWSKGMYQIESFSQLRCVFAFMRKIVLSTIFGSKKSTEEKDRKFFRTYMSTVIMVMCRMYTCRIAAPLYEVLPIAMICILVQYWCRYRSLRRSEHPPEKYFWPHYCLCRWPYSRRQYFIRLLYNEMLAATRISCTNTYGTQRQQNACYS